MLEVRMCWGISGHGCKPRKRRCNYLIFLGPNFLIYKSDDNSGIQSNSKIYCVSTNPKLRHNGSWPIDRNHFGIFLLVPQSPNAIEILLLFLL